MPTRSDALAAAESLLADGQTDAARAELQRFLGDEASLPPTELDRATSLCERLGMVARAVQLARRRLELEPRDGPCWLRLAQLHEELGDLERAARCRRRAAALAGPDAPEAPEDPPDPLVDPGARPGPRPDPQPLVDLSFDRADIARFLDLFSGREDVHARQWYDSARDRAGYSPVHAPLGPAAVRAHLDGRQTLGSYLLRADASVRFCVLDLDVGKPALEAAAGDPTRVGELSDALHAAGQALLGRLDELQVGPFALFEDSGHKGRHLWLFFAEPQAAGRVLRLGRALVASLPAIDGRLAVEFFPKQARAAGKGLGNLVKLPLGVHRLSGRRAWLLHRDGTVDPRPLERLRELLRLPTEALRRLEERLESPEHRPSADVPAETEGDDPVPPSGAPTLPKPPDRDWTAADFRTDPQFRQVLDGCAPLRRLVRRASAGDPLDHDELVTLRHTLGHLDRGPAGINYLVRRVPGLGPGASLGRRLGGSPASCANIRRKLPGLVRKVGCDCRFGPRLPTYPNPLLHLGIAGRTARLVVLEGDCPPEDDEPRNDGPAPADPSGDPEPEGAPDPAQQPATGLDPQADHETGS